MKTIYIIKSPCLSLFSNLNLDHAPPILPPCYPYLLLKQARQHAAGRSPCQHFFASSSNPSSPLISSSIHRHEAVGELSGQGFYPLWCAEADKSCPRLGHLTSYHRDPQGTTSTHQTFTWRSMLHDCKVCAKLMHHIFSHENLSLLQLFTYILH